MTLSIGQAIAALGIAFLVGLETGLGIWFVMVDRARKRRRWPMLPGGRRIEWRPQQMPK